MIVKKITLKNFRQYKGRQEITLSTDKNKNVTVILGVNTSGKTTLIEAFKWCLYNQTTYKKRELINAEVKEEMKERDSEDVFVEIILVHENIEYIIRRNQVYQKATSGSVVLGKTNLNVMYKSDTGELKPIRENERQNSINNILPSELSDYFFFDGERIGDIGRKSDIKNAVQGLMGLDVVKKAKDRLDPTRKASIVSELESELDTGSVLENKKLEEAKLKIQESLETRRTALENTNKEITYYKEQEQKLSELILANKDAKRNQTEKLNLEIEIKKIEKTLESMEENIVSFFSNGAVNFFALPLIERAQRILLNTDEDIEGIGGMTAKAIDEILKREVCICGCDLSSNEEALSNILDEKKLLPPYHIGTMVRQTKDNFNLMEQNGKNFKNQIIESFRLYKMGLDDLSDKESYLEELSEKNKGLKDVAKLEGRRNSALKKLKELENKKEVLIKGIGSDEERLKINSDRRDSLIRASKKNVDIMTCLAYCEKIYDWLDETHEKEEKKVKENLEKNVNEIFNDMYHGNRYVTIDENYRVNLGTRLGEDVISTDESKGLEAVKNFSFVAGLVKLAKEKVQESDSNSQEIHVEEPYPLIMDAPFSNVDEIHIDNIVKIIPNVAEQVVLILMEKDWNYAEDSLSNKIGYLYEINKVNNKETHSVLEEREKYV